MFMANKEIKFSVCGRCGPKGAKTPSELLVYATGLVYSRAEKVINKFLVSCGTTSAQFNVLVSLLHCQNVRGLSQIEISRKMLVSQGNITRLLDNLHKNKYITRKEDSFDRRHKLINITPKGRALCAAVMPRYAKLVKSLTSCLDDKTKKSTGLSLLYWLKELEGYDYESSK